MSPVPRSSPSPGWRASLGGAWDATSNWLVRLPKPPGSTTRQRPLVSLVIQRYRLPRCWIGWRTGSQETCQVSTSPRNLKIEMAAIEDLTESLLTKEDIPTVLALTAEAGWNQTSADWLLMIREGHAICLRDQADRPVATALALPLGAQIGWISMVLVTAAWRRKGLATRLVHHCAAWLEAKGRHALLDATPAGQKVYERMGFKTIAKM